MALSEKTKTVLERIYVRDADDLYPDRQATPLSDGTYPVRDTGSNWRHGDEVPTTTKDMNKLFEWEHGDKVYGTHAEEHPGMKNYIKDIDKAYGKESDYKDIYVDIYTGRVLVSKQLEKLKK
jgi:hypothetical protein